MGEFPKSWKSSGGGLVVMMFPDWKNEKSPRDLWPAGASSTKMGLRKGGRSPLLIPDI